MQGNVLGKSGGSGSLGGLNLYAQSTEPSKKDGIWIKTETNKFDYKNVELIPDLPNEIEEVSQTPINATKWISIGTDIWGTLGGMHLQKYNVRTKLGTTIQNVFPYTFNTNGCMEAVGSDIYMFGFSIKTGSDVKESAKILAYKYNIETNTCTRLANMPNYFLGSGGHSAVVGTDIYLMRMYTGTSFKYETYKYDTLTDTYTKLNIDISDGSCVAVGTDIYIFTNSTETNKSNYKYNTITGETSNISNLAKYNTTTSKVLFGDYIYFFSSTGEVSKYGIITDTFTTISKHEVTGNAVVMDNNIYLIQKKLENPLYYSRIYLYTTYSLKNDTVYVLLKDMRFKTLLSKIMEIYFSDAFIYEGNENQPYPVYCGTGQEWVQINNEEEN